MMTTDRSELIGGFVTPEIKRAVKKEAIELSKAEGKRISVSSLLYRILCERYFASSESDAPVIEPSNAETRVV